MTDRQVGFEGHIFSPKKSTNFYISSSRKRQVYLRYGPTFIGKMFFKFNDEKINIIDSRYLIWNKTNTNFVIQVTTIWSIDIIFHFSTKQTNDQSWDG